MFLLHHCKQFFTRIKKYNKEILALDAKDVISTFFLKKKKKKERNTSRRDSLINCAQDRSHKSIHSIKFLTYTNIFSVISIIPFPFRLFPLVWRSTSSFLLGLELLSLYQASSQPGIPHRVCQYTERPGPNVEFHRQIDRPRQ